VVRYTENPFALPPMKIIVLLFVIFILGSLFSALYFLLKDRSQSDRVVKALTVRVVLSVVLFALLMLGFYFGIISDKL
jgi:multisubunit Na+/H+ antiporter MnhF subunit